MLTECSADLFGFARVEGRTVVAAFDGGKITSRPRIVARSQHHAGNTAEAVDAIGSHLSILDLSGHRLRSR